MNTNKHVCRHAHKPRCIYVYIHIYIVREREREMDGSRAKSRRWKWTDTRDRETARKSLERGDLQTNTHTYALT